MSEISQFAKFEEGVAAADRLLALMERLGSKITNTKLAHAEDLGQIDALIWQFTPAGRPYPAVEGFLKTLLRHETYDGAIVTVLGASSFVAEQTASAPMCNLPDDAPFVQFAYWTGEEDRDAWVFDFGHDKIRCLPVSMDAADLTSARAESYGVFSTIEHFIGFLYTDAQIREWLPKIG